MAPGVAVDIITSHAGVDTLGWTVCSWAAPGSYQMSSLLTCMTDNPLTVNSLYTTGKTFRQKAGQSFGFNYEEYHTL